MNSHSKRQKWFRYQLFLADCIKRVKFWKRWKLCENFKTLSELLNSLLVDKNMKSECEQDVIFFKIRYKVHDSAPFLFPWGKK